MRVLGAFATVAVPVALLGTASASAKETNPYGCPPIGSTSLVSWWGGPTLYRFPGGPITACRSVGNRYEHTELAGFADFRPSMYDGAAETSVALVQGNCVAIRTDESGTAWSINTLRIFDLTARTSWSLRVLDVAQLGTTGVADLRLGAGCSAAWRTTSSGERSEPQVIKYRNSSGEQTVTDGRTLDEVAAALNGAPPDAKPLVAPNSVRPQIKGTPTARLSGRLTISLSYSYNKKSARSRYPGLGLDGSPRSLTVSVNGWPAKAVPGNRGASITTSVRGQVSTGPTVRRGSMVTVRATACAVGCRSQAFNVKVSAGKYPLVAKPLRGSPVDSSNAAHTSHSPTDSLHDGRPLRRRAGSIGRDDPLHAGGRQVPGRNWLRVRLRDRRARPDPGL